MYRFLMKNKLAIAALVIFILAVGQLFVGGDRDRDLYANTEPPADLARSNRETAMDEIGIDPSSGNGDFAPEGEFGPDDSPMGFTPDEDLVDSAEGFDPTPEEDQSFFDDDFDNAVDDFDDGAE